MEQQGAAVREKLEGRVAELQRKVEKSENSGDAVAEVTSLREHNSGNTARQCFDVDTCWRAGHGFVLLQVKRVMNGVFHSLRAEFDLSESYSGHAVLGVIVATIKVTFFFSGYKHELCSFISETI